MSPSRTATRSCSAACLEIVHRDGVAVLEPIAALRPGNVQQDRPPDQRVLQLLRAEARRTEAGDLCRGDPVVGVAVVKDVRQAVPVRRRLEVQDDRVVGVAHLSRQRLARPLLGSDDVIAPGGHRVAKAVEPSVRAGLRTALIEVHCQRDDPAGADQSGGLPDMSGGEVVGRPDLIVGTPPAPVAVFGDVFVEDVARRGHGRERPYPTG